MMMLEFSISFFSFSQHGRYSQKDREARETKKIRKRLLKAQIFTYLLDFACNQILSPQRA